MFVQKFIADTLTKIHAALCCYSDVCLVDTLSIACPTYCFGKNIPKKVKIYLNLKAANDE